MEGVTVDEYPNPQLKEPISLRQDRIEKVVGVSMDAEFVTNTLTHLNFVVSDSKQQSWQIQVPSFRVDVEIEDDLVEEVTRHYGYDRIKSTYPYAPQAGRFDSTRSHDQVLLGVLGGVGFVEAFNYVFTNIPREQLFWGETPPKKSRSGNRAFGAGELFGEILLLGESQI